MVNKTWRIIPRPLLETILNNHAQHHRVPQPLILHGPRGVGKTTLILERLLERWNTGPHLTGYVDFAQPIESHHPAHGQSFPWTSWSNCPPPPLPALQTQLERCLESMAQTGVKLGTITSHQIFTTLNKWHGLNATLRRILQSNSKSSKAALSDKVSNSVLWGRAVCAVSARLNVDEVDGIVEGGKVSMEEVAYFKEAMAGLRVAKEVIRVQQGWRRNAVRDLNRVGGFSRSLANSATDWPCLLLELLSSGAEIDYFQAFGWTPQEAKMHMVDDYFSPSEWNVVVEVLGPSPRHLFELYALKQSNFYQKVMDEKGSTFEDIVDAYLAFLQVTVVNPAMDKALSLLQKFANDARNGKIPKDRLRFGAPWRHPPRTDNPALRLEWAKLQLMDFVQSLVNTEFGVNYLADCSLEILDDPSCVALVECGSNIVVSEDAGEPGF
ncbi:hypothetical protein RHGRI_017950 [Rhododendron griersonianum]|uniref:Uncharacterized protein n=1 Tax=Rhododendron griersonianum TaxID=479676 RepID=A0AAV6JZR6_9ERIC|nr:hypothetical protein RHGRI_017950 [Rhododendron griersonianum]